ncbi:polysaccharide biosynthesis/export family protein [Porphyrobacter sp. LM 6]|uniref:polysaccharide biosynthesis/export family protein n=1 Tax=Porphyrobacter sp. LM 6 TaxID=1896196 RepID=UPI0008638C74|nr:polysaccharide biosynthesis/export family protein [Porphyrobacter sp. LM 6]AOL93020.1 polysaccharide export outer membrane protein [Porphyrobacter sp. LM 6]
MSKRQSSILRLALACTFAAGLSACSTHYELGGDPDLSVVPANELPAPSIADFTAVSRPYIVGPFDRLTIDVFGIEELTEREVQVDAAGRISFPLAGVVQVSGQTPGEIEGLLAERLRQSYVRNPQVTVNLKEAVSQVVTVGGQVKKPGLYPVMGRMTLLQAIARAEGSGEFSDLQNVVVFRTIEGRRLAALYDVRAIQRGAYADPEIYPNDVVMIGDDASSRLFRDVLTGLSLVSGPLVIAIDRFAN